MRRMTTLLVPAFAVAGIALMSVAAGAQNPGGSPEGKKLKNPVASSAESIAAGKAAFQKNCRFCHGADAKGNGPMAPEGTHPSNLTDDKWDRGSTDGEIFLVIENGAGPKFDMKGYKSKMAETDVWNVVNYLRSLQAVMQWAVGVCVGAPPAAPSPHGCRPSSRGASGRRRGGPQSSGSARRAAADPFPHKTHTPEGGVCRLPQAWRSGLIAGIPSVRPA